MLLYYCFGFICDDLTHCLLFNEEQINREVELIEQGKTELQPEDRDKIKL